jgi:hypothetical protein
MSHPAGRDGQLPVVIGSGLTGLSISHYLSSAGMDHLLVGRRPDMSPRLGESLNLEGTLLLWEMFPQLSRFFFPKRDALGFFGDYEVLCDFEVSQRAVSRAIFRTLGYAPAMEFLQVDRIGFDAALWDLASARAVQRHARRPSARLARLLGAVPLRERPHRRSLEHATQLRLHVRPAPRVPRGVRHGAAPCHAMEGTHAAARPHRRRTKPAGVVRVERAGRRTADLRGLT